MAKFNPLDPLGLFQERDGSLVGRLDTAHYLVHRRREATAQDALSALWPPPDPLGIFKRGNPGKQAKSNGLSGATIGNPIPIEWAAEVVPLKNQARETLVGKGYSERMVDKALHWAEEWLMGMARSMAPGNMALQKTVVVSGYADIANRAEKWLTGIQAAFAPAVGGAR